MPEFMNGLSLSTLLVPINGSSGEDLSFSVLFDEIKEARRSDANYLTQGDWETAFKRSDWDLVITLSAMSLTERSKDLMLAAWLTEGLAQKHSFQGLSFGLALVHRLISEFWDSFYPALEEGNEERTAQLIWLNTTLSAVVGVLPITEGGCYGLLKYDESRQVENLVRQNPDAMAIALEDGKINSEMFQRSVAQTETQFLQCKHAEVRESLIGCRQLQTTVDGFFENDAPSFSVLDNSLSQTCRLIERLLTERGFNVIETASSNGELLQPVSVAGADEISPAAPAHGGAMRCIPLTREEAFNMLNGIAQFFKQSEPHSPVPYLIERAVKWGHMPLESWLKDVIKDEKVVDGIRDVLGTASSSA